MESGIKYAKGNFSLGRHFTDGMDVKRCLRRWSQKINQRLHGTTRKIPQEVFEKEEKSKLITLPPEEFQMMKVGTRKVYHDCHIYMDYNYDSVLFFYVDKEVEIQLSQKLLRVSYEGKETAVYPRLTGRGQFSTQESHYPTYKYKRYCDTEYQKKY